MITFAEARQAVSRAWPDYELATYGYETDISWLLILLPETAGGRIPAVSKRTGNIRWINENADEYTQDRPVHLAADVATARVLFEGCWRCGADLVTYHECL